VKKLEHLFRLIEKKRESMIALQKELAAVPAIAPQNGGQGEWDKAQVLLARLPQWGLKEVELLCAPDTRVPSGKRPNLVVTLPGASDRRRFWIMSHLDIVPPGSASLWNTDPYAVVEKDGCLWGRGVEDNQQGLVASLTAAAALRELGQEPPCTVKLLLAADEETSSQYGIQYLLKGQALFNPEDLVLVPDGGNAEGSMIQIAEKSLLWLKFETLGKQCHAARPQDGINAFVAGSQLVLKLHDLSRLYPQQDPIFDPPGSTFCPTKKEANVPNINTIPAEDVFYLDCRILPSLPVEEVLGTIQSLCREVEREHGVRVSLTTVQRVSSPQTPADSPLVGALKDALREVYGVEGRVWGVGGGTVSAFLRQAGIQTVVWARIEETAHLPNEHCRIENMIGDAKVMARLMLSLEP